MNFWNFSIKYSSIPIFATMYAVNVTSPAQLPLVSGCRNSGDPRGSECNSTFKARCMLMKHKRLEHRVPTEQKTLDFFGLKKCDDLVKDMTKENRNLPLPKVQFAFKSTRPPRNPQKNIVDISDDSQQNRSSDTQHEDTSLSDPNGKQIFIKSCLNPDIFFFIFDASFVD